MDGILRNLLRLCQITRGLRLTLFNGLTRTLRNNAHPTRKTRMSRVTSLRFTCRGLKRRKFCLEVGLITMNKTTSSGSTVLRCINGSVEEVTLTRVIRRSILSTLYEGFHHGNFHRLLHITMRKAVNGSRAFIDNMTTRLIMSTSGLNCIFHPRQPIHKTSNKGKRATRLNGYLLRQETMLTRSIKVMARRLIPMSIRVSTHVRRPTIRHARATRTIANRGSSFHFIGDRRHLKPIRRQNRVRARLVVPRDRGVLILRRMLFTHRTVGTLCRTRNLLITRGSSIKMVLLCRTSETQVIQLRVISSRVLSKTLTSGTLCLTRVRLRMTSIRHVSRDSHLVVCRMEIMKGPVQRQPRAFGRVLVTIVRSRMISFSFCRYF